MQTLECLRRWVQSWGIFGIQVDRRWDTRITVGQSPSKDLFVDSRAICRASLVMRKMLSDPVNRSNPTPGDLGREKWHISLSRENVLAFIILMDLAHGQYERTPRQLGPEHLFNVVYTAHKYDMMRCVRNISQTWLAIIADGYKVRSGEVRWMLFISWALGEENIFRESALKLARECTTDEDGDLVDSTGACLAGFDYVLDTDIYDDLVQYRTRRQHVLFNECRRMGDSLTACPNTEKSLESQDVDIYGDGVRFGRVLDLVPYKTVLALGVLTLNAASHRLELLFFGEPPEATRKMSLAELETRLYATFAQYYLWDCGTALSQACRQRLEELGGPVEEKHVRVLRGNSTKSFIRGAKESSGPAEEWEGWADKTARGVLDTDSPLG